MSALFNTVALRAMEIIEFRFHNLFISAYQRRSVVRNRRPCRILVEAKKAGLVEEVGPLFETLKRESYWIADPIVQWALGAAGEA